MAFTAINTEFNYKMGNYSTGSTNEKKQPNNSPVLFSISIIIL